MKAISSAMNFEKTTVSKKMSRAAAKKLENEVTDITLMTTRRIFLHLYKKHETVLLYTALFLCAVWGVGEAIK